MTVFLITDANKRWMSGTRVPTSGLHQAGDLVLNSEPTISGVEGSRYIIFSWICVTTGTPGVWSANRTLTGG